MICNIFSIRLFNSPEKILIKMHKTRKLLEMESRVAVPVSVLPWVIYMAGEL